MKQQTTTTEPSLVLLIGAPLAAGAVDTEILELLESLARNDATHDLEKLKNARKELDGFKKAMNVNRFASGERLVYP